MGNKTFLSYFWIPAQVFFPIPADVLFYLNLFLDFVSFYFYCFLLLFCYFLLVFTFFYWIFFTLLLFFFWSQTIFFSFPFFKFLKGFFGIFSINTQIQTVYLGRIIWNFLVNFLQKYYMKKTVKIYLLMCCVIIFS